MSSPKLTAVFNKYADKIVALDEILDGNMEGYKARLTPAELKKVLADIDDPVRNEAVDSVMLNAIALGEVFADSSDRAFLTVRTLQQMVDTNGAFAPSTLSARLLTKAESIEADVIKAATDYRGRKDLKKLSF